MADPPIRPKVVSLRPEEPDPNLIGMLERLLTQAKAGQVVALVYVAMPANGQPEFSWGGEALQAEFHSAATALSLAIGMATLAEYK